MAEQAHEHPEHDQLVPIDDTMRDELIQRLTSAGESPTPEGTDQIEQVIDILNELLTSESDES